MSTLPKAVQKQIDDANRIANELYGPEAVAAAAAKANGEPPPAPAPAPAAAEPAPAPAPTPGEQPPAATAAAPAPAPTPLPTETFEHRYKVLQGKYNAEVPRLQKQFQEQKEQMQSLQSQLVATQNLLASLSAQREPAPAAASGVPPAQSKLVKDEEVREFGADLVDVMRRVAREEQGALLPEIDRRLAPVTQRVDQVAQNVQATGQRVAQNDRQAVFALLDEKVPNWQTLNGDSGFLAWLDQIDPFSNRQRGTLLEQALNANDGPRVVAFFDGYVKEHAAVTPPPAAPAAAPVAPQRTLDQMVAPGTPRTGPVSAQDVSGKRVWTRAEITAFYASTGNGSFKGTPEQRKAMEADIFAAQREGRIR